MSRKRKRQIVQEGARSINEALEQAEESSIPFVMADDEISVVGDANETETSKYDFTVDFRIPKEGGGSEKKTKEFSNVFITPRKELKVEKCLIPILSYFRKTDGPDVDKLTPEEQAKLAKQLDEEFLDYAYDLVAVVLGIDEELKDYMEIASVFTNVAKIMRAFPSMVNAADTFFE